MPNIKIERCDRHFTRNAMQGCPDDAEQDCETLFNVSPKQRVPSIASTPIEALAIRCRRRDLRFVSVGLHAQLLSIDGR